MVPRHDGVSILKVSILCFSGRFCKQCQCPHSMESAPQDSCPWRVSKWDDTTPAWFQRFSPLDPDLSSLDSNIGAWYILSSSPKSTLSFKDSFPTGEPPFMEDSTHSFLLIIYQHGHFFPPSSHFCPAVTTGQSEYDYAHFIDVKTKDDSAKAELWARTSHLVRSVLKPRHWDSKTRREGSPEQADHSGTGKTQGGEWEGC